MKYVIVAIAGTSHGYIYQLLNESGKRIKEFSLGYQDDILLRNKYNPTYSIYTGKGKVRDYKKLLTSFDEISSIISSL